MAVRLTSSTTDSTSPATSPWWSSFLQWLGYGPASTPSYGIPAQQRLATQLAWQGLQSGSGVSSNASASAPHIVATEREVSLQQDVSFHRDTLSQLETDLSTLTTKGKDLIAYAERTTRSGVRGFRDQYIVNRQKEELKESGLQAILEKYRNYLDPKFFKEDPRNQIPPGEALIALRDVMQNALIPQQRLNFQNAIGRYRSTFGIDPIGIPTNYASTAQNETDEGNEADGEEE